MSFLRKAAASLFAVLLLSQTAFASKPPTLPNSYDGVAPSARSMAMGSVGTGFIINNDAFYYNSAALGLMNGTRIAISVVADRTTNASPNSVAASDPVGQGIISGMGIKDTGGIVWQALSDYSITNTTSEGWNKSETSINAITITTGQKSSSGYSVGLNLSYLYGKIGESWVNTIANDAYSNIASGNGFTFDLSFIYPTAAGFAFGINLKNIAGFMFWDDYNTEQLPFSVRTGVGYTSRSFSFGMDWNKTFYRFGNLKEDTIHFGLEQYISNFLCVRGGFITDDEFDTDSMKYSYGLGLRLRGYDISFAAEQYDIDKERFSKYVISFSVLVI